MDSSTLVKLSDRQARILAMLVDEGLRQKQVVDRLQVSRMTVANELRAARLALGAKTIPQATAFFERQRRG